MKMLKCGALENLKEFMHVSDLAKASILLKIIHQFHTLMLEQVMKFLF